MEKEINFDVTNSIEDHHEIENIDLKEYLDQEEEFLK